MVEVQGIPDSDAEAPQAQEEEGEEGKEDEEGIRHNGIDIIVQIVQTSKLFDTIRL